MSNSLLSKDRKKLDALVTFRTGRTFREAPEATQPGAFRVLSYKDLDEGQLIAAEEAKRQEVLVLCDPEPKWRGELLRPGDLLFAGKGGRSQAVLFDQPEDTLANSLFVVISADPKELDPGYLLWFLNSPTVQTYFRANMVGTTVPNISLSILKELEVPVPPLAVQRVIGRVHDLALREGRILSELVQQRKALVEEVLTQVTN